MPTEEITDAMVEVVRQRLADGRTIADADVRELVTEIDRLRKWLTDIVAYQDPCVGGCIPQYMAENALKGDEPYA